MDSLSAASLTSLQLNLAHWQAMLAHVQSLAPEEACGLLAGTRQGESALVRAVYPVENSQHSPVRFHMEPAGQLAAFLDMEQAGQELVGIFHSHPGGPETPSPADLAEAYYPEAAYLIWFPAPAGWTCLAYQIGGRQVRTVELTLLPEQE